MTFEPHRGTMATLDLTMVSRLSPRSSLSGMRLETPLNEFGKIIEKIAPHPIR